MNPSKSAVVNLCVLSPWETMRFLLLATWSHMAHSHTWDRESEGVNDTCT